MSRDMSSYVDAFEQTIRSTLELATSLSDAEWDLPTDLAGWSVRDNVAHLAALERELLGAPLPPPLETYGPHVRGDWGRHMENGVAARRGASGAELVAELRECLEARLVGLRRAPLDPAATVVGPMGMETTNERMMAIRVFDCWMHEQDVRRAVGRPGNLDGPAAEVSRDRILMALPYVVAKGAGAAPGQSVRFEVGGAVPGTVTVTVGPDGRAAIGGDEQPTVRLATDWETFVRLVGGRVRADRAEVDVAGDAELGRHVLAALAITP